MMITIILMVVVVVVSSLILLYIRNNNNNKKVEFFESRQKKKEYIRILSKLSNLAVQPYQGDLDTYLTANTKQPDEYYPQLWLYEQPKGLLKNVGTGRYLTVSADETKVVLSPLATTKHQHQHQQKAQQWTINTTTGFITSRLRGAHARKKRRPTTKTPLVLHLEGSNAKENAMVVVADQGEGAAFQWYVEKVSVDIRHIVLVPGTLNGKTRHVVEDKLSSSHAGTYSMWVNVSSMAYRKGFLKNIFTRGDNTPGLWIAPLENRLQVLWGDNTIITTTTTKVAFELDTWFHVALVVENGTTTVRLFIDGQVAAEYDNMNKKELTPPQQQGQVVFHNKGGFDGRLSNAEFVNKALTVTEIGERMRASNPEPSCKEQRRAETKVPANLTKALDQWALSKGLLHVQKNALCPPTTLGGTTVSFKGGSSGSVSTTEVNLLENQYYQVSVWALAGAGTGGLTLRPYYKGTNWTGLWKTVPSSSKKKSPPQWQQLEWSFLNNGGGDDAAAASEFGFEVSSSSSLKQSRSSNSSSSNQNKNALFLPVVSLKVLSAPADDTNDNVKVKEFRSNGTHSTCAIQPSKVGLNAAGGWCALKDVRDEYYIEATFDKLYHIYKIHTRGRGDYPQWTTEYRLEYYDVYYNQWRRYGATFEGNRDMNTVKSNSVSILTSKIRVYVVSFQSWPALRLAFSGSIGLKDKCAEYKIKAAHDMNAAERARYLTLYNKECKKVSYNEYAQALKTQSDTQEAARTKVEKAQLDAAACQQKFQETKDQLDTLTRRFKKTASASASASASAF